MAKRIVIIEDDLNIMELLVYLFENEGYHVSSFTKSQTAADIGLLSPDVVLLDVNLAGSPKRGDEICAELKGLALTEKLPVFLLSAEKNLQSIATNCRADDYLSKPFDIDKLLMKVKNVQL
ncbi:response regulator transcription factor [Pedobacter sp. N23S346]|uniref:response regulator transcription factor n=1 Tax=Pedobacter sp. N23S346 TaxID=3402750 RepID=UPI003ACBEBF6